MTTMKDPSLTVYPNRQQMLALIEARAAADKVRTERANERRSVAPQGPSPFPNCVVSPV